MIKANPELKHDPLKPTCTACGAQPWQNCTHRSAVEPAHAPTDLRAQAEQPAAVVLADLRRNEKP